MLYTRHYFKHFLLYQAYFSPQISKLDMNIFLICRWNWGTGFNHRPEVTMIKLVLVRTGPVLWDFSLCNCTGLKSQWEPVFGLIPCYCCLKIVSEFIFDLVFCDGSPVRWWSVEAAEVCVRKVSAVMFARHCRRRMPVHLGVQRYSLA